MFVPRRYIIVPLLIAVLLSSSPAALYAQAPSPAPLPLPIRLQAGTLIPGDAPASTVFDLVVPGDTPDDAGLYVVQFIGPIQPAWRQALEALGGTVLGYLPDYAFKVRMSPAQADAVATLTVVNFVDVFHTAYKSTGDLGFAGVGLYAVRLETDAPPATANEIAAYVERVVAADGDTFTVWADTAQIMQVRRLPHVAWVQTFDQNASHGEINFASIVGATSVNQSGYDGSTQIIAVADTGLGSGIAATAHPDMPEARIVGIQNLEVQDAGGCYIVQRDGPRDAAKGHGTHVALAAVGGGTTDGVGHGVAPAAGLYFQALEEYLDFYDTCALAYDDGYFLAGIPSRLQTLFEQAYAAGARIHANSWGSNATGAYTLNSAAADEFAWRHQDMLITFSAGNAGIDANRDGMIDRDSIGAPGTAKNVLTVGASENDRGGDYACDTRLTYASSDNYQTPLTCDVMGGQNTLGTYGERCPANFPAAPLADDLTAGNAHQMAAFSSRGPTDDGRIKPDVVAPGTWVLSGYAGLFRRGYDDARNPVNSLFQIDGWGLPFNQEYKYFGGTSMANPIAAGGAVVVRDFYAKAHGHEASAALVKATLINTAVDLLDENNDGYNDNYFPIPNIHEGWGRIDLNAATRISAFVDEPAGVMTGVESAYTYFLAAGQPFKVTLVWTDFPAEETAAVNLVNDLDLLVTGPDGATYRGNVFSGGWTQQGGAADRRNNVENVFVENAPAGYWTVTVRGHNVPTGTQPFALVVDGAFDTPPPPDQPPAVALETPRDGATVSGVVTLTASAHDDEAVDGVAFFVNGELLLLDRHAPYQTDWDSTTMPNGTVELRVTATDRAGLASTTSVGVTVDNPVVAEPPPDRPPTVVIVAPAAQAVVEELVTIAVDAYDDDSIVLVELFIDDTLVGADPAAPYLFHWDSATAPNGEHMIVAQATDSAGQTTATRLSVQVDNPLAVDDLHVALVSPHDGAEVQGTVELVAEVHALATVSHVEFYVDQISIGRVHATPYAFSWASGDVANGAHVISAAVIDAEGQIASASIDVFVDNAAVFAANSAYGCFSEFLDDDASGDFRTFLPLAAP